MGPFINFPLETSSLSFYPDAMSKLVLLTLHRRYILKDVEWAVHKAQTGGRGKHPGKDCAPWGPARCAGHRRGPWRVSASVSSLQGVKKSYFVQKTGRKSAPMSNETNVQGIPGLEEIFLTLKLD